MLADRLEEAIACGDKALALARERGQRGYEAWALRHLGEIASCRYPFDAETAEGHYREALGVASELGMRPLVAQLSPRPRQALPAYGQTAGGSGAPHHRDEVVPRDGDAVLAGAGGDGAARAGLSEADNGK